MTLVLLSVVVQVLADGMGKDLNGNEVPMGNYIFEIFYQDVNGWKITKTKDLVVIR